MPQAIKVEYHSGRVVIKRKLPPMIAFRMRWRRLQDPNVRSVMVIDDWWLDCFEEAWI